MTKTGDLLPIHFEMIYTSIRNGIIRRFWKAHRLRSIIYAPQRYWQLWTSMGIGTAAFSFKAVFAHVCWLQYTEEGSVEPRKYIQAGN